MARAATLAPAAALVLAAALSLALAPVPAVAGTICGVVRDAATSAPIARAGVFVRQPAGAYTGLYAATEWNGSFCVYFVPPGVYDLEIRVDDYAVAYVPGVRVSGTVTEVPVSIATGGLVLQRPWPNPAVHQVRLSWTMPREGAARLAVIDVRGRVVIVWSAGDLPAGVRTIDWDLRGAHGARLPAGVYYVLLEAGRERRVRRFVCLP
ncbi:MAG TPA: carboxypeptidase regulatory-like domain-containing protein [Candidatus Eisenbacteria bacterium]